MSTTVPTTDVPGPAEGAGAHQPSWRESVAVARAESWENRRCPRRVRHEVRDGLAVAAFSAAASTAVAAALTFLLSLAG